MNEQNATGVVFPKPISPDWTIESLLDWLAADDGRLNDAALRRPLRTLEVALTGTCWALGSDDASPGVREPAVVSLVRSIALRTRRHPALRARTIADVLSEGDQTAAAAGRPSGADAIAPH